MNLILYLLLNGLAVFLTAYLLPGVEVDSFLTAIIVAVVLGLLNTFVKPLLTVLTLPITVITLGLFLLVINVLMVMGADALIDGFTVDNWLIALIFSFVLTLISSFLSAFDGK